MSKSWTAAQKCAIGTRDKSLLVCAAAGSGKTATLTERIIESLTDKTNPVDIDRMLVVTFTRAAAAELKQRISSALSGALAKDPSNKRLSEQMVKMPSAAICTIDSFYLDIVRSNFDKLELSPSFTTAEESELHLLSLSVMEDVIDDFYESHGDSFSQIAECFVNVRNGENLSNIFLNVYSRVESFPEGIEFLKLSAEKLSDDSKLDFFEGHFGNLTASQLIEKLSYYEAIFKNYIEENSPLSTVSALISDKLFVSKFIELIERKDYKACYEHVYSYSPVRLPVLSKLGIDNAEEFKSIRNKFKKDIGQIKDHSFGIHPENISPVLNKTAEIIYYLYELILEFKIRLDAEKKQKNILSFTDIRNYAKRLLVNEDGSPTKTATEYSEKYSQIYIDEYQDVDRVQDLIFKSIAKPDARFMVGDIKQSIYGFRGAEPSVFASYRKNFADIKEAKEATEASVFMSNNFRCDAPVIDFANCVCSYFFGECCDSIGYTKNDDLICSKIVENRVTDEVPVELSVIVSDKCEEDESDEIDEIDEASGKEIEAKYIANKIYELLRTGKKADGSPIKPHDIAVLFRSQSMGEYLRRALAALGIDSASASDADYFENPDVMLVLCLLNAIDNPQRDIYLAGLLRSPFFNFSLDELIIIRQSADTSYSLYDALKITCENEGVLSEKCKDFDKTLCELRELAASMPVDKLLKHLYASELFLASGLISSDDSNNLLHLYEYARKFESYSFKGLYNFIAYINNLIDKKAKFTIGASSNKDGKVALMTIHKSKGLEFPVCFVCNVSSPFNLQDTRESLICDGQNGIALKISDGSGYARINTPMREALGKALQTTQIEEEMRVLYVALTRARERLYVTASVSSSEEKLMAKAEHNKKFKCAYTVRSARSYLDWILPALTGISTESFCNISFIKKEDIGEPVVSEIESEELDLSRQGYFKKLLKERFSFVYPYAAATKLPAKISVSEMLSDDEDSLLIIQNDIPHEVPVPEILTKNDDMPINKQSTAAQRGTATHLFLQFFDFEYARKQGVRNELCRLIEKKFIPESSAELVYINELEAFLESDLFSKIQSAKRVVREQRFNILLDVDVLDNDPDFLRQTEGEFLAVQGVIDLIIEDKNGDIFLYDYKTDRLSAVELSSDELLKKKMAERHAPQLGYYKEAVKRLFGKECRAAFIYSTHAAKEIEL